MALLRSRGETLKRLGSEWEWKFHDERVTIRGHLWFDQYTQKGGDAVDFFRYFYGESEEQAAAMLLNCSVADLEKLPARSPPQGTPFKEREEKIKQLEHLNYLLIPKNFVVYKKELKEKAKYLDLLEVDNAKQMKETMLKLQKSFLTCFVMKIQQTQIKQDIIKLLS